MHPVRVRYDVQRARAAGLSTAWVLSTYGVPARTQQRMLHESIRFGMSDSELRAQHSVGRPGALSPTHRELLARWLQGEPHLPRVEFLRRLTSDHDYRGGKTAFYDYLQTLPKPQKAPLPVARFEGVAGEFAQHDFGTLTVRYQDGEEEKITFYAGRLKFSRALHVCLVEGETSEGFIRGLEAFGAAVGGLPLLNVMDNTKAAVLKRSKDPQTGETQVHLQRDLADFLAEVGVFAEPTAPYSGNQKGSVENLVRFVKENFLGSRKFRNREDLETQLGEWLYWVNQERPCAATRTIPFTRLAEEAGYLKPVPQTPEGYGLRRVAIAGRDGWVRHGGYRYSVPHAWIGQVVEVRLHRQVLVLQYAGARVQHPRTPENRRFSLLPAHQPALFLKPRGAIMVQRQLLMDLDPVVERFFTELVHRRPDTWRKKDVFPLWDAYQAHGTTAFLAAITGCVQAGTYGSEYVLATLGTRPTASAAARRAA